MIHDDGQQWIDFGDPLWNAAIMLDRDVIWTEPTFELKTRDEEHEQDYWLRLLLVR